MRYDMYPYQQMEQKKSQQIERKIGQQIAKVLKRCPKCSSSNVYKRIRAVRVIPRVKIYICRECKFEFDIPKLEEKANRVSKKTY